MSKSDGRCKECGAILALVGGRHRCIPGAAQALAAARGREAQGNKRVVRDDRAARKSSAGGVGSRHAKATIVPDRVVGTAQVKTASAVSVTEQSERARDVGGLIPPARKSAMNSDPRRNLAQAGVAPGPAEAKRKVGRPRSAKSLTSTKPWEAEGVSRRTWYYRRQAERRGK